MAINTLQQCFDQTRGYLNDARLVSTGEVWPNAVLQVHFNEAYRRMWNCLMGVSKRVQRIIYINFPANNTVLIPSNYNITDFDEPELVEERPANASIAIASTSLAAGTIRVTTSAPHGLGTAGQVVEVIVGQVAGTTAPWGQWFGTIFDTSNIDLNGSSGDGTAGTGGVLTTSSVQRFVPMNSQDAANACLDGQPAQYLGCYIWINSMLQFRGAIGSQQLRITYWASGNPPTLPATNIGIDNCIDFLACATAANAARANGWNNLADQLKATAYGATQQADGLGGLLAEFLGIQVKSLQRGPQRRRRPFRDKLSRFGNYVWGSG